MREVLIAMKAFRTMQALGGAALLAALLGLSVSARAMEFDRGRALYENHCQSCHEDWAHTRKGRKVTTLQNLRSRVASWSVHAGLHWGEEEIEDVTRFLNERFYQLTE